jgi:non-ribosomal peptide synthetase component E (peptide arylation enzyme)
MMDGESSVRIEISDDLGSGAASAEAALRGRAKNHGDNIAFTDPPDRSDRGLGQSRQVTFAQANAIADTLCIRFRESGLSEGDVIAIQAPNIVEAPLLILGAWRAGLIPCLLPLLWRLDEIHQAFSRIKPMAAVSVSHYSGEARAQTLGEAAARHMSIRYLFAFGDQVPDGITPINDWLDTPELIVEDEENKAGMMPDISNSTAIITWAVGEQGPYPVPRSHDQLMALARLFSAQLKLGGSDVMLNTYPFTSIAALAGHLVAPLLTGCEVVQHLPFDFDVFLQQLNAHDVTYTAVPAPVIAALEERNNLRSGALRLNRLGCVWPSPHAIEVAPALFETAVPIFDMYNFSELALMIRERTSGSDPALLPLGKIYPSDHDGDDEDEEPVLETRVHGTVSQENGKQVLKGTLLVRGSTVPSEPFTLDGLEGEKGLKADSHGYLDTGIGAVVGDALEGYFRCEKREDLIYHGGAVIAAIELDELYAEFDDFLDAAAFVLDDAVIGERIFAAVVPRPELSPSLVRLKQFLDAKRVAPYKTPDQLVIVKSIPRSGAGAVLRDQILSQL